MRQQIFKFGIVLIISLVANNSMLAQTVPSGNRKEATGASEVLSGLQSPNPLKKPKLNTDNLGPVVPKSLEADAEALLERWRKDYSSQKNSSHPFRTESNSYEGTGSETLYRKRLYCLPSEIEMPFNGQVKKSLDLFTKKKRKLIPIMLSLGEYYFPTIESIFDRYGLPTELKYLAIVESRLDPTAVSPSGAKGIWQFMLPTAKAYDLEVNSLIDERLDLEKSTEAAARHLRDLYQVYNDWLVSIAAYNAGIGTVNKAIRRSGGKCDFWSLYKYLPRQTRDYIPLFIATFYAMHYHNEYKLFPADFSYPADIDTIHIHQKISIAKLARTANVSESFFRLINPQFKGEYVPGHIRTYAVTLPLSAITLLEEYLSSPEYSQNGGMPGAPEKDPISTPKRESCPPSPARSYTIRRGDSLSKIARRHGITLKALMKANSITDVKYKLIPGRELQIPLDTGA